MRNVKGSVDAEKTASLYSVSAACGAGSSNLKKRGLSGSYTVEAAVVMTVVVMSVWTMIRAACGLHDRVTSGMILHEMVELWAHEEQLDLGQAEALGGEALKHLFLSKGDSISLEEKRESVGGSLSGKEQGFQIQMSRFKPQDFLRKMTLLEELGQKDGDSV